jgi:inorganic pyrophosphatase
LSQNNNQISKKIGKWVKIDGWGNAEEAKQELLESFAAYKK